MAQIKAFPNPDTGAYGLQKKAGDTALLDSRSGEAPTAPPIPSTGKVPFSNPVDAPRMAEAGRSVNNTPPNMSVNLTESFINEAVGGNPLAPTIIAAGGTGQDLLGARPNGNEDQVLSGANPVGSGPIINPQSPAVTMPVVAPPSPQSTFE